MMKHKNVQLRFVLMILLVNLLISSSIFAQTPEKGNFNFSLQPGFSVPFGLPSNSSAIIPQLGMDFNFGKIGFRVTEQFFKTSPEFDINGYLEPFGSNISQTGVKEKNSNFVIGIVPYFNLPIKENFSLIPALGLKYLIQNGATNYVVYTPDPRISLLEYPDGDARRSAFQIEPSIRAVFGKPTKTVRYFVEAGYSFTVSKNEMTYKYRDLSGIYLPDGSIDPDLLGTAPIITGTQKIMPNSLWLAIGLELNITSSPSSKNHNTSRSNRSVQKANIEKDPDEGDDIPDEQINSTELKPLLVVSKGANKNKQGDAITFSWEPLNIKECGDDLIELFEIIEKPSPVMDEKGVVYNSTGARKQLFKKYLKLSEVKKDGNNHTYSITKEQMPELFEQNKEFTWQMTVLDKNGNKPQCSWGGKNTVKNTYKSTGGCSIELTIDTIKCLGRNNNLNEYEICFHITNLSTGLPCDNGEVLFGTHQNGALEIFGISGSNYIQINPSNPTILDPLIINYGNSTNQLCVNVSTPSNVDEIKVRANPNTDDPTKEFYGSASDTWDLPPCGCDFCDDVEIMVNQTNTTPIVTSHSGYDEISFPVEIQYGPNKVNRIIAEIIVFQHEVNNPNCKTCFTDNAGHGVFVNPTKNVISGNNWQNRGNAVFYPSSSSYSREATWFNTLQGGLDLSAPFGRPTSIDLNIGVPELNSLNCCQDKIRFSIRYSFITIEDKENVCKVCEIVKTYCYVRDGNGKGNKLTCLQRKTIKTVD